MMTNKSCRHNIIVIGIAIILSAAIYILSAKKHTEVSNITSRLFEVNNGWGYDILVDDTSIIIHQEYIPVQENNHPFKNRDAAELAAKMVINKLKNGEEPSLSKFDLEEIVRLNDSKTTK